MRFSFFAVFSNGGGVKKPFRHVFCCKPLFFYFNITQNSCYKFIGNFSNARRKLCLDYWKKRKSKWNKQNLGVYVRWIIVLCDEIENYCGNCGRQLEIKRGDCPYCGAPLSVTLVTVSKKEREWINPDRWVIGRKGWIQAQFLKRWFPKYEDWLYNTKHKSLGELPADEIKQTAEEYKKFLEERTEQMKSWASRKEETGKPEKKPEEMSDEEFKRFVIDKLKTLEKDIKQVTDSLKKEQ